VLNVQTKVVQLILIAAAAIVKSFLPELTAAAKQSVEFTRSEFIRVLKHFRQVLSGHQAEGHVEVIWHDAKGEQFNAIMSAKVLPRIGKYFSSRRRCQSFATLKNRFGN
jgi:hypothetical protein